MPDATDNIVISRLEEAAQNLITLIAFHERTGGSQSQVARLKGKVQGVHLALSYVREVTNEPQPFAEDAPWT